MPDPLPIHPNGHCLVRVTISSNRARGRQIEGLVLIDTGATRTSILEEIAISCGMQVGSPEFHTVANGEQQERNTYHGTMEILGVTLSKQNLRFGSLPKKFGENLVVDREGLIGLIGTDYLSYCVFSFNDPPDTFTLDVKPFALRKVRD